APEGGARRRGRRPGPDRRIAAAAGDPQPAARARDAARAILLALPEAAARPLRPLPAVWGVAVVRESAVDRVEWPPVRMPDRVAVANRPHRPSGGPNPPAAPPARHRPAGAI